MMLVITDVAGRLGRQVAERLRRRDRAVADQRQPRVKEDHLIDAALADSFPASDPPPWTLGVAGSR